MSDYLSLGICNEGLVRELEALRKTLRLDDQRLFLESVSKFADESAFARQLTLMSWGWYFPPPLADPTDVAARVFAVMCRLVSISDSPPSCPICGDATEFVETSTTTFGWKYRCVQGRRRLTAAQARKFHKKNTWRCSGSVSACSGTWFEGTKSVRKVLNLLFCWVNRVPVVRARMNVECGEHMAVDYYSMAREVCEVIMSNEVLSRPFGGPGICVEVDECFLTRRKYHKGRRMKTGTVTLFGIYERDTKLGFHFQVKDKSSAVLISEIQRFLLPGTHIMSDAMKSYKKLPEYGFVHEFVTHDKEFVNSKDTTVHTQNVEVRNRWTKSYIRNFRANRPLNSYCAEYAYR